MDVSTNRGKMWNDHGFCCESISSRANQNMRRIEFLEQAQESLLGFTKEREDKKEEYKSVLTIIVLLFTFSIRILRLQANINN